MRSRRRSLSCLSWWFPRVQAAGLPVPRTEIVKAPDLSSWGQWVGRGAPPGFEGFLGELRRAIQKIGPCPVFLRTGLGSGKHEWKDTCFLADEKNLERHVHALYEWSELVDFLGLPTDVWVVREILKTEPAFEAFNGFPVTKERRWFVRNGRVLCRHPYWPEGAVAEGRPSDPDWKTKLEALNREEPGEVEALTKLSERVAITVPGFWSVDWLWTKDRGWVLTDMAEGEESFHWAGCPNAVGGEGP